MKYFVGLALLIVLITANAGEKSAAGLVSLSGSSGIIFVVLNGSGNSTCGDGKRYWLTPDNDYKKALLSIALSAQMAGKRIWVNSNGQCKADYPYSNAYELQNISLLND